MPAAGLELTMRTKTTITILVFACILLGLAWLMRGNKPRSSTAPSRLLPVEVDKITRLALARPSFEVECARSGAGWTIVKPVKARADVGAVDRLLHTLGDMQLLETITPEQRNRRALTLDDYGIGEKPRARLALGNTRTNLTLLLGRDSLDDVLYARFANEDNVLTTTAGILAALPQNADDLRDRTLIRGEVAGASKLEITRPSSGFMQATRKEGQWTMQQPLKGARLDNEKLKKLLKALNDSRVERFMTAVDAGNTGLDDSQTAVRISIWNSDDAAGQQLILGKEVSGHKDEVYARLADTECVCTVKKAVLDAFDIRASDLRETVVFPMSPADIVFVSLREGERKLEFRRNGKDWLIAEPRRMKTDPATMNELLARLCAMQVEQFIEITETPPSTGLDPAIRSIEVSTALPLEQEASETQKREAGLRKVLLVGSEAAEDRGFYARFEDEPSLFRIGREPLKSMLNGLYSSLPSHFGATTNDAAGAIWIDPLLYCNRTMLELDRTSIVAISLFKEGLEQAVCKGDSGSWQPVPPLTGKIRTNVVEDILDAVSNLEAIEIRCQGGGNPASYGLEDPAARLTFGLADVNGIRKTLLIGFRAGSDGVYAMIQGQDVVFVLPVRVVGRLLRDLVPEEEHGG